jgi:hypothetical protein
VEHLRHHRRAPVPATPLAQCDRRGNGSARVIRRERRRRDHARPAPNDRSGA